MPLINGKSKKAFSENVEKEMHAGKPQKQALAIAYNVKNKNKKKYAKGGQIPPSAKTESRPDPDEAGQEEISRNRGNKASKEDSWTDQPTVRQAQKPSITRLSQPKIVGSDAFSVRRREDVEQSKDFMDSIPPESDKAQPQERDNEMDAKKSGDPVKKSPIHSKNLNMYAKGGKINEVEPMHLAEADEVEHPEGLEEDNDEMAPSEEVIMADHFARGGMAHDMDDQPEPEEEIEHHDSIAAAIMAKRDRLHAMIDSGAADMDHAAEAKMASGGTVESGSPDMNYADGGEVMGKKDGLFTFPREKKESSIKSRDSIHSDDSNMADLSRNADEDANEEDQLSFNALRKENYSESEGLRQLNNPEDSAEHGDDIDSDKHDMVSAIRSKMNMRRQFKQR